MAAKPGAVDLGDASLAADRNAFTLDAIASRNLCASTKMGLPTDWQSVFGGRNSAGFGTVPPDPLTGSHRARAVQDAARRR